MAGHGVITPGWEAAALADPHVLHALHDPQRMGWLAAGEAALRRGDAAAAQEAFERAASMLHAADSEMGLVRAALQAGRYREALAFCAHTAGTHRESVAPAALYALLLAVVGQGPYAQQVLAQARERAPRDPLLAQAQALVSTGFGVPATALLQPPHRLAPQALAVPGQAPAPARAVVRGGAVLLGDGRHALAPLRLVQGTQALWVRDGLGRTVAARLRRADTGSGVALLALDNGLGAPGLAYAGAAPRPGRPGYAVAQPAQVASATPAWPWMFRGFIGRVAARDGQQEVGIDLPPGADGVLVMDDLGRVAGIGVRTADGAALLRPLSAWPEAAPATTAQPVSAAAGAVSGMAPDEAYERALRTALQLIVQH